MLYLHHFVLFSRASLRSLCMSNHVPNRALFASLCPPFACCFALSLHAQSCAESRSISTTLHSHCAAVSRYLCVPNPVSNCALFVLLFCALFTLLYTLFAQLIHNLFTLLYTLFAPPFPALFSALIESDLSPVLGENT